MLDDDTTTPTLTRVAALALCCALNAHVGSFSSISEIGAHILSGNVFDPVAIDPLLPNWKEEMRELTGSIATPVTADSFLVLPNDTSSLELPNLLLPPQLHNDGNYVISLSQLCRYMASKAEELGVEIYPGFAAAQPIVESGSVRGVVTRDVGIAKDGSHRSTYEPGVELRARQTVLAEGARGSCTEQLVEQFDLRKDKHPQAYGLGIKEVWQVPDAQFQSGFVQHTLGWPLQDSVWSKTFGGSFLYHQDPNLVLVGMVVGLDYQNPYLNPYKEFQRFKTHPDVRKHLENGTCLSYGGRVLNEGGYHSLPKLTMPGALLVGCAAGFLNAVKIKGTHTAIGSGALAAESIFAALQDGTSVADTGELPPADDNKLVEELTSYSDAMDKSWITEELYQVRNSHEAFSRWGVGGGLVYTGFTTFVSKGREPWTFPHSKLDCDTTGLAGNFQEITYPPPDNKLTFDLLTNLQRSGTYHEENQPSHLRIKPQLSYVPKSLSLPVHAGPEQRFCPAQVYEYVEKGQEKELVINAQNCIHCKCCSIKMPREYIDWTVPEGGGGPQYQIM
jgi:electron-transferring-flavoprotein dehydrogenase